MEPEVKQIKPRKVRSDRRSMPTEEMVELRERGIRTDTIGAIAGVSRQYVEKELKKAGCAIAAVERFKKDESNLLHEKRKLILESISQEDVDLMKGKLKDKAISYAILLDKQRLIDQVDVSKVGVDFTWISLVADAKGEGRGAKLSPGGETVDVPVLLVSNPKQEEVRLDGE